MLGTPVPLHISAKFNSNWTIVKRKRLKCEKLTDTEVTPETAITIPYMDLLIQVRQQQFTGRCVVPPRHQGFQYFSRVPVLH